jgi:hypothetical protein
MGDILERVKAWPRNLAGEPIFKTSEGAIFYATLIFDKPARVKEVVKVRKTTLFDIGHRRKSPNPDLDFLMQLAVKAQFARECLEEVERLKNNTYSLNQGGR